MTSKWRSLAGVTLWALVVHGCGTRSGDDAPTGSVPDAATLRDAAAAHDAAPAHDTAAGGSADLAADGPGGRDGDGASTEADGGADTGADRAVGSPAGSAGCGKQSPGGDLRIKVEDDDLPYRVLLPKGYDRQRPYPLVFFLHGRNDTLFNFPLFTNDVATALADVAILVYPKSITSGWEEREASHTQLMKALKQRAEEQYCVDSSRFVIMGFSSGGWFTSMVACTVESELAGIVIAGAGRKRECMGRKPVMVIAGRQDQAFAEAQSAADHYRTRNGCMSATTPAAVSPCASYTACAPGASTTFCPWDGIHMWPLGFGGKAVVDFLSRL